MDREYVYIDDCNITSIAYDEDTQVALVEFGILGRFGRFDIPNNIHKEVMAARSKSNYLGYYIKSYYTERKVENE